MVKATQVAQASNVKNVLAVPSKPVRKIKHFKGFSPQEEEKVIKFYNELVPGDTERTIDIEMIVTEAFPKFEETIGEESFAKVKRYFGIGSKSVTKNINVAETKSLIAKLRTIENAQYYITGYKEMVKEIAEKLLYAPVSMNDLEKVKIIRMFLIIFSEPEIFVEDYVTRMVKGKFQVCFSEEKAVSNNKEIFRPEELMIINNQKIKYATGYFYDMLIMDFQRLYHLCNNKFKRELEEVLEFCELRYDAKTEHFISVNKCMIDASFGKIRNLKKKIFEVRPCYPLEAFCNKKIIDEKLDITGLYVIYKSFKLHHWKNDAKIMMKTYKTLSGARFVEKQQPYYEVLDGLWITDDAEAERWIALFEYLAEKEYTVKTEVNGNGEPLTNIEYYNTGALIALFEYAINVGYLSQYTKVYQDFELAKKLLAIEGAEEKFLKLKRGEVRSEEMRELLGIDEQYEKNVLKINKLDVVHPYIQCVIKFAVDNKYASSEEDVDISLIENVFIPSNESILDKFYYNKIDKTEFKKQIGFDEEFAEVYFDTSKIDIKAVEAKLLEIKRYGRKDQIHKSKLLIALYCYIVKNEIGCGPKNKPAKRNKGLKPEILESLIK